MNFQEFKEKYEHKPVEEYSNRVTHKPMVSVCVMTYNQKDYIKECLDGILMQKTNFPFEILLGEDGSTDGTREICIEYAKKYPDKIRLFLHHRENNIKIDGKPSGRFNMLYNLFSVKGKYIALCEGDDYWTYPFKLQKQVEFLEGNEDVGIVHTKYEIFHEAINKFVTHEKKLFNPAFSAFRNYLFTGDMRTLTVMFRARFLKDIQKLLDDGIMTKMKYGDRTTFLTIASKSKIGYIDEVTGMYRVTKSISATKTTILAERYRIGLRRWGTLQMFCDYLGIDDKEYMKLLYKRKTKCKVKLFILKTPVASNIFHYIFKKYRMDGRTDVY